jgi:ferric-dicitrate binding protein FerR (iron transport regulator)
METDLTYYINLITRYLAGEATPDEILTLSDWLKSDSGNRKIFEEYQKTWLVVEKVKINNNIDIDEEWGEIKPLINNSLSREETKVVPIIPIRGEKIIKWNFFYNAVRIAAIFIVFAAISFVTYHYLNQPKTEQLFAQTEIIENKLPDGTSVTLNKGSSIEYPEKFKNDKRTVTLKGEAYFNVTPDKTRPFVIAADDIRVEVLGTSFYVSADAAKGSVEVILTSGKVAVYHKDKPSERTILEPGEKAEFSKTEGKISKSENNDVNYMAFKTKKLVFSDTPLSEVVLDLNKVYHSNIKIKNNNLANCPVTTTIDANISNLDGALNILSGTLFINISKTSSDIEISGSGCK